ncbi:hypothetical protein ACSLOF_26375, partial [Escherichia coli]|uniref:hypothetical protein n=1 Tax=Escherichia coli TaxID=562 RepID=UPI003EDF2CC9
GIIKPSGSFKTQMHFGTSFNALFFQRPAVNEAPFKAILSHMFCESGFVVDQVNNLSLSCGLFSELPDESDPFLQPFDVADAHV